MTNGYCQRDKLFSYFFGGGCSTPISLAASALRRKTLIASTGTMEIAPALFGPLHLVGGVRYGGFITDWFGYCWLMLASQIFNVPSAPGLTMRLPSALTPMLLTKAVGPLRVRVS
jgi:hypothetical protein